MDVTQANWSEVDNDNSAAAPNGAPEGMQPGGLNNTMRAMMGAVKRWFNWGIPKSTAGSGTAYTLSYGVAPTALADGMTHVVAFHAACGVNPTLNVNSLGALPLYRYVGGAWAQVTDANTITAGLIARVAYNALEGSYRIISSATPIDAAFLSVANIFRGLLTMSGAAVNEAQGADIASATSTDIGAATGNYVKVTGTTTITGLGTIQAGTERTVTFTGALTLTHNATSLILPGAADILTAAGDSAIFRSLGSGNWKCVAYQKASGASLVAPTSVGFRAPADGIGAPGAFAKMTLANATFNVGGYWSDSTKRFTPPAGLYSLQVSLSVVLANSYLRLYLYKNGAVVGMAEQGNSGNWIISLSVAMTDRANGTDYYEAYWAGGALAAPAATEAWFSAVGISQ